MEKYNKNILFLTFCFFIFIKCANDKTPKYLSIEPRSVNIGHIQMKIPYTVKIKFSNNNKLDTIEILGISESCNCVYDSINLPLKIGPNSIQELTFVYENHDTAFHGDFTQEIVVHTKSDSLFQKIEIKGNVK